MSETTLEAGMLCEVRDPKKKCWDVATLLHTGQGLEQAERQPRVFVKYHNWGWEYSEWVCAERVAPLGTHSDLSSRSGRISRTDARLPVTRPAGAARPASSTAGARLSRHRSPAASMSRVLSLSKIAEAQMAMVLSATAHSETMFLDTLGLEATLATDDLGTACHPCLMSLEINCLLNDMNVHETPMSWSTKVCKLNLQGKLTASQLKQHWEDHACLSLLHSPLHEYDYIRIIMGLRLVGCDYRRVRDLFLPERSMYVIEKAVKEHFYAVESDFVRRTSSTLVWKRNSKKLEALRRAKQLIWTPLKNSFDGLFDVCAFLQRDEVTLGPDGVTIDESSSSSSSDDGESEEHDEDSDNEEEGEQEDSGDGMRDARGSGGRASAADVHIPLGAEIGTIVSPRQSEKRKWTLQSGNAEGQPSPAKRLRVRQVDVLSMRFASVDNICTGDIVDALLDNVWQPARVITHCWGAVLVESLVGDHTKNRWVQREALGPLHAHSEDLPRKLLKACRGAICVELGPGLFQHLFQTKQGQHPSASDCDKPAVLTHEEIAQLMSAVHLHVNDGAAAAAVAPSLDAAAKAFGTRNAAQWRTLWEFMCSQLHNNGAVTDSLCKHAPTGDKEDDDDQGQPENSDDDADDVVMDLPGFIAFDTSRVSRDATALPRDAKEVPRDPGFEERVARTVADYSACAPVRDFEWQDAELQQLLQGLLEHGQDAYPWEPIQRKFLPHLSIPVVRACIKDGMQQASKRALDDDARRPRPTPSSSVLGCLQEAFDAIVAERADY